MDIMHFNNYRNNFDDMAEKVSVSDLNEDFKKKVKGSLSLLRERHKRKELSNFSLGFNILGENKRVTIAFFDRNIKKGRVMNFFEDEAELHKFFNNLMGCELC